MEELEDMPGMSPISRISRLGTFDLKKFRVILRSSKCVSKTGPPKSCVGDVFCMGGDPLRIKGHPHLCVESGIKSLQLKAKSSKK